MATALRREPSALAPVTSPTAANALTAIVGDPLNRLLFASLTVLIAAGYSLTLPFAFTQQLSLRNWQFLTPRLLGFAIALGVGMAFLLTVQVYSFRRAAAARRASGDKALSGFALVVSLLPTFLCCTPVIPTVLATFGLSAISVYSTTRSLLPIERLTDQIAQFPTYNEGWLGAYRQLNL